MSAGGGASGDRWDFFVSYTQADRSWAEWIAWVIEEDGYRVLIQAWDFVPGSNWLARMQAGTRDAARTIAVFSDAYLRSVGGSAEWQAAMASDPDGSGRKLLILRISPCELRGLLAGRVGVDLFGVDEIVARDRLRDMIAAARSGRAKPSVAPGFPGPDRAVPSEPVFPGGPGEQVPGSPPGPSGGRRRWLVPTASGVTAIAVLAVIAIVLWWPGRGPAVSTTAKPRLPPPGLCAVSGHAGGQTMITPWTSPQRDHECVGYSSNSSFIFRNPPLTDDGSPQQALQDERIRYDQKQVFLENTQAEKEQGPSRPVIGLVYFAGLTAGRNDDYDSAEAEELEGLLVAQKIALAEESGPLLKVVVANGGSKMQAAVNVARMLIPLFARDPRLLGVLGLDRSVRQVQQAIAMFEAHGIPMVATTLSADGIGAGDTYYFQMSQSNSQEALLMLRYIRDVVPAYFEQPRKVYNSGGKIRATRILIYRPSSPEPTDLYISTLVQDLQREAPRFTGVPPPTITSQLGNSLCGPSTVDVYAGRHDMPPGNSYDTFTQFLQTIASDCAATDEPFIIADDGVTRFIADPAKRDQPGLGNAAVSYVTKGIAIMRTGPECLSQVTAAKVRGALQEFCQTYAGIENGLSGLPEQQGQEITFLWTGERVGLAYDAARLFFQAELNYEGSNNEPVTRAAIPGEFETHPYHGVTGSMSFTANSHISANSPYGMPLTIVRIQLSSPTAVPTCEYPGEDGHLFGPGPNPGACPSGPA